MLPTLRSDPLVRMLGHTTTTLLLSTLTYYAVPLRFDRIQPWTLGRAAVAALAIGLLVLLFRSHTRRSRRRQGRDYVRIQWLLSALYGIVLLFALGYAALAIQLQGQFVGLENRTMRSTSRSPSSRPWASATSIRQGARRACSRRRTWCST